MLMRKTILVPAFNELHNDYRVYRTASVLVEMGYEPLVVGVSYPHSKAVQPWGDGIRLERLPVQQTRGKKRYLDYNRQLAALARREQFRAVHANDLDTLFGSVRVARAQRIPLIYDSHELFTEQAPLVGRWKERLAWQLLERLLIKRASGVITVCDGIADELSRRYGIARPTVIRNMPPYREIPPCTKIQETLGLPADQNIILFQGGLLVGIGLENVVRMGHYVRNSVIVLIGSGPLEATLHELVAAEGLSERVKFIPHVPFRELADYTASATVGVILFPPHGLNSYYLLPNKLFEYMMAGLPVVCSPLPEMARIVNQYQTGLLIKPDDPQQMATEIEAFLQDGVTYQRCVANARAAAKVLNWDQEKKRLIAFYKDVLVSG